MTAAKPSENGIAYQTPFTPNHIGITIKAGSKKMSCRDKDRKILILTLPIL